MIALCNFLCCPEVDFRLCIIGTTNLDSWYGGTECNRVKFLNGGIAIALEFLEGQFNIHPGVETFNAISRMLYFLYKSLGQLHNNQGNSLPTVSTNNSKEPKTFAGGVV